jgi:hypothetical protein
MYYGVFAMLTAQLLSSQAALAQPSKEVLTRLNSSFRPGFTAVETPAGRSLSFCKLLDVRLTVTDPITGTEGFVQNRIYEARNGSDRTVLLLPPTGGENILDQGYANHLCSAGFRVVILQTWQNQLEVSLDPAMHDNGAVRALSAIRHTLDYLKPSRGAQVGILGTSVGALSASLALGFDPRLSSGVLIVGGFGFSEIVARSTETGATKLRDARMKAFGLKTMDDYVALLAEKVVIEPGDFADFSGRKNVLAFVGTRDVTVPTKNQLALVKGYGAESEEYAGDHTQTILNTFTWKRGKITAFFEKNLQ